MHKRFAMGLTEVFVLAIGLSMDAFAVSICKGISIGKAGVKHALIAGIWFGVFQALMPVIGYFCGRTFSDAIASIDHWIALILLGAIGLNMIKEAWQQRNEPQCESPSRMLSGRMILMQAIATSIDALAVGVSFAVMRVNILQAAASICLTTFLISLAGTQLGKRFGSLGREKAQLTGGVILVGIGLKIFIEHMFF